MERNPGAEDHSPGEDPEPERGSGPAQPGDDTAPMPLDEKAAWEQIVAGYGEAPKADDMAPATEPGGDARTAARPAPGSGGPSSGSGSEGEGEGAGDEGGTSVRSFTVYSAGSGPRDWRAPAGEDDGDEEEDDEGHFVPPEPPPLPEADATTKFAWLAVLGGPLLLIFTVLFQQDITWWIGTLGVGGFLGGFATLVARMRDGRDEDDWDDPGRGAVV